MECNVILDLLPLYEEGLCREETNEIIDKHLQECEYCREIKKAMSMNIEQLNIEKPALKEDKLLEKYYGYLIKKFTLIGLISYIVLVSILLVIF
ncbi:zf-HC2 domain-containing protein [Clostridiaceae bacterium M8S5]|nr:zf-HC2 domain-containing protein [Clostridiaceae bacterium M8S5]